MQDWARGVERFAAAMAVASGAAAAAVAHAADQPLYGPPPDWVTAVPIPTAASNDSAAVQLLLWSTQSRFGKEGDQTYSEVATKLASDEGLARAGNLMESWNPETETLTVHRAQIIRNGKVIDLLAGGRKLTVLRRETNLESAMLDGRLTATLQVEGLRVGDVLDVAVTLKRTDPALAGRSEGGALAVHAGTARRIYIREVWPADKDLRWKASEDLGRPVLSRPAGGTQLLFDFKDHVTPDAPKDAPARFALRSYLQASEFRSWPDVSSTAAALWTKPIQLGTDSPLHAEVARIRADNPTPEARAMAALRLVQDQVRYVYIGMNLGGYTPAAADLTWSRRFGDCKGKTALLLALLHELGVSAEPAMVLTAGADGLDERLPMFESFDHVMVRASIGGQTYWLDGTRSGDRRLTELPIPAFHWALPVRAAGATLERLIPREPPSPLEDLKVTLDLTGGPDKPAPLQAEETYREDAAVAFNLAVKQLTPSDLDKALRSFWLQHYPWAQASNVAFAYDEADRVARLSFKGTARPPWSKSGRARDLWLDDASLGWNTSYTRQPGPHHDAPYAVNHPAYSRAAVRVLLPDHGANASLLNREAIDERLAGMALHRTTELKDGVVEIAATSRSFEPEFPASEAAHDETRLRDLSTHDVLVRITRPLSEPAETAPPPDPTLAETPTDAAGYAARAARFGMRGELAKAEADLVQAVKLEPTSAKYLYDRGVVRLRMDRIAAALADFDQAIRLKPDDALALSARGQLRLVLKQDALAETDLAAALKASHSNVELAFRIASTYGDLGRYDGQVQYLTLALGKASEAQKPELLNERCYARARWNRQLDQAAADCDAALAARADAPAFLDSRALVRLRQGRYDLALADFDAALAKRPDLSASLYGRGLTKMRLGRAEEARKDIEAARSGDPGVADRFAKDGLKP